MVQDSGGMSVTMKNSSRESSLSWLLLLSAYILFFSVCATVIYPGRESENYLNPLLLIALMTGGLLNSVVLTNHFKETADIKFPKIIWCLTNLFFIALPLLTPGFPRTKWATWCFLTMNIFCFPIGLAVTFLFYLMFFLLVALLPEKGNMYDANSPWLVPKIILTEWLPYFVAGYFQWFILLPRIAARLRSMKTLRTIWAISITIICFIGLIAAFIAVFGQSHEGFPLSREELAELKDKGERGDYEACNCLVLYYEEDEKEYNYWLLKGASYGDPRAEYSMYNHLTHAFYNKGEDPQLVRQAYEYLKSAASKEHTRAQAQMGDLYRDGGDRIRDKVNPILNIKQDWQKAAFWYRRASSNGDYFVMVRLSELLPQNSNAKKDLIEAYKWTIIAQPRFNRKSSLYDKTEKQQKAIVAKAKRLHFNSAAIIKAAQTLAQQEANHIPSIDPLADSNCGYLKQWRSVNHDYDWLSSSLTE
jgi:hypothetical protein